MVEAIVCIFICVLTGFCGRDRRIGFFGTFIIAVITTPLVVLPVLLLTAPSRQVERRRRGSKASVIVAGENYHLGELDMSTHRLCTDEGCFFEQRSLENDGYSVSLVSW